MSQSPESPDSSLPAQAGSANSSAIVDLDDTPLMEEVALQHASKLSIQSTKPPLHVSGYEQEQFLGRGAFGEVWKAVDSNSGRVVAIKFYSHRGGLDWSHMTREVEKLQYLFSDRHVVQLFDVGWDADPPYYVMEYMAYGSLEDRLREGPMTVPEAVKITREIAEGLAHAHDKGILHCDLKPGNIMLDQDGRPRLADFGQARLKHEHAPALGTLFYMAPEQADLSAAPDARWDVYALGAILYRMITGELPYLDEEISEELSSQESLEDRLKSYSELSIRQKKPAAHRLHPAVDKSLADFIDNCLTVDPRHRYANVQAVLHALDLRESRKSQRPMMLVGFVGPALAVILMAFATGFLFRKTLDTAARNLIDRAGESNAFAAQSVADRFGLEIDRRWRILEQDAGHPQLETWLGEESDKPSQELQAWIEKRHAYWNTQFVRGTEAAYWFALDQRGKVRAISPPAESLIGSYFGYREYFHGQGRELSPFDSPPELIKRPHRSNAFRSQPTNQPAVAFSVPVFSSSGERIGILAMETAMGRFAKFSGSRNQLAVLVDLKADQTGQAGLIVEHPELEQVDHSEALYYESPSQLAAIEEICQAYTGPDGSTKSSATIFDYQDPCLPGEAGWFASVAPVTVVRGDGDTLNTDWAILVEEQSEQTLSPLNRLKSLFFYGGLAVLLAAALIIGGMWWIVVWIANAPGRLRSLRFWTTTASLHSQGSVTTTSMRNTNPS